jgi:DNA-binding CsgD family transcriptional regulator
MVGWLETDFQNAESVDMNPAIFPGKTTSVIFSRRESEIITLLTRGMTNKEIAEYLYVGAETVKTHVAHILKKLGARNRTEAAIKAATLKSREPVYSLPMDLSSVHPQAPKYGMHNDAPLINLSDKPMIVKST